MTGGPQISGHVSFVNRDATPSISSTASIAGRQPGQSGFGDCTCPSLTCRAVVHYGVPKPTFRPVDTYAFAQYVPAATAPPGASVINTSNPTGSSFKNIRIKANSNPTFNNNTLLQGVIWIEQPNQVKFNGGAVIQGVIVTSTDGPTTRRPTSRRTWSSSRVARRSTASARCRRPTTSRSACGSSPARPCSSRVHRKFGGNFNTINGTIIASRMEFSGTAGGTIKGSVINLRDTAVTLAGTSDIIIESQGTANHPAGVFFGSRYEPLPFTYQEFIP
jgi:hypothetical protein